MGFRILSIGEILFDVYPDARQLGGAPFNFAYHLFRLKQEVAFASRIGSDENGELITGALRHWGFPLDLIQDDADHDTGRVAVQLDADGVPSFDILSGVAYDFITLNQTLRTYLDSGVDLVYFGTLAQRSDTSRQAIQGLLAGRSEKTLALCDVNLRQNFFTREVLQFSFEHSDLVKLSDQEFSLVSGIFSLPGDEPAAARAMMGQFSIKSLCLTRGKGGSTLFCDDQTFHLSEPSDRRTPIIDTVGAGDAFAAIYAVGTLLCWPGDEILARASRFATAVCGFKGAVPARADFYDPYLIGEPQHR